MNSRRRVQAALRFETPDRLPGNESPWEQTAAGLSAAAGLASGVRGGRTLRFDERLVSRAEPLQGASDLPGVRPPEHHIAVLDVEQFG